MDSGRTRSRRRFTRSVDTAGATFELNQAQYAAFIAVWEQKLNNGTDWFQMRIATPTTETLTLSEVRFVSDISEQHLAFSNWNISVSIEYKDAAKLTEEQLFDLLYPPPSEAVPVNSLTYGGENLYFNDNYLTYTP